MKYKKDFGSFVIETDVEFSELMDIISKDIEQKIHDIETILNLQFKEPIPIFIYSDIVKFKEKTQYPYTVKPVLGAYSILGIRIYIDTANAAYDKIITCINHELAHYICKKYIYKNKKVSTWLDEGFVQNISGERDNLQDDEQFKLFLLEHVYTDGKIIPDIEFLYNHGNKFGYFIDNETNKYNGYVWSYLMVRYLLEEYNIEYIYEIINDKDKLAEISKSLPVTMYDHYKKKIRGRYM